MKKTILHIGLHKTGTSYLQRHYFPGVPGITYWGRDFFGKIGEKDLPGTLLISGEGMSGRPWNNEWRTGIRNDYHYIRSFRRAITNLKSMFPEAHILVVFRKHGDLVISLYRQYIQEGGVLTFDEFYGDGGVIRKEDLSFIERIDFLKENFSKVDILSFEQFKIEGQEYYDRFFRHLGYEESNVKSIEKTNQSISGHKVEVLRKINRVYPKVPKAVRNLLAKNGFTPRNILQSRLKFWKSEKSAELLKIQEDINAHFRDDWEYVENHCWK